ncbi:metal-dependent transcriptional regulator [Streptococcus hillyeri]|uniref:Manganese transport regulator n=1 Tax=Streptococcus hillyeri TaxID=2282420 RepID=A0A3L9DVS8_9STRE|nr:metal-dependent transcriptional regulator [Streptococcus hillyeri]RLY04358.1 metal-dependent transcriptional regulator [Streptococcus hillyeri]
MTPNKEDYLKCIHDLRERGDKISNKMIADYLQVSTPSVSEMLKKMQAENWVVKDKNLGYALTEKADLIVTELYRKHRLLEVFLQEHLHYTTDETHQEAEILEHAVSTMFIDRLEDYLNFPEFCPHGGTIPEKDAPLTEKNHQTLSQVSESGDYQLVRVHDEIELLNYLNRNDFHLGTHFTLIEIDTYAQTYQIQFNNKELTIPLAIAKLIFVK